MTKQCCEKRGVRAVQKVTISLVLAGCLFALMLSDLSASPPWFRGKRLQCDDCRQATGPTGGDVGGAWYWMRSPEQEKTVIAGYYNRYCVRCHGVDGRGVWDIPHVPDFTNARWQASRSDEQLARIIQEGRGAVMPPFRGTLSLEESWAMGRYLRTLAVANEPARPTPGAAK